MKVYCYLLDHARTIVKVGRTTNTASGRMWDYVSKHGLDILPNTLWSTGVSDDKDCEQFIHTQLVKRGYKRVRKIGVGAQELFQAPRSVTKKQATSQVKQLINEWEIKYGVDVDVDDITSNTKPDRGNIDLILRGIDARKHITEAKLASNRAEQGVESYREEYNAPAYSPDTKPEPIQNLLGNLGLLAIAGGLVYTLFA